VTTSIRLDHLVAVFACWFFLWALVALWDEIRDLWNGGKKG
jgi:hypothetical protein